jgi:formylglycine-generating enzyme
MVRTANETKTLRNEDAAKEGSAMGASCCGPRAADGRAGVGEDPRVPLRVARRAAGGSDTTTWIPLPGGEFLMGTGDADGFPDDGEGPVRPVEVAPFSIAAHAVTNAQFRDFAEDTGYRTGAERYGWSFVFAAFVPAALRRGAMRPVGTPWWIRVDGAHWRCPEGPGSTVEDRWDHPAVHIDHNDALAYCRWARCRLPTEAEWEYAARGGLEQARYPWGDDLTPGGTHMCNIWHGVFPTKNTAEDGYVGTAPVDAFPPNGFGLHNAVGNVWEWCADWWGVTHSPRRTRNPRGPRTGHDRVMRGGSHLCHDSYCNRYRVAARTHNSPDSTSGNLGFRCARD